MTVRFLADEDLRTVVIEGLRSRERTIDILDLKTTRLRGTGDPALLELAALEGRILIHPRSADDAAALSLPSWCRKANFRRIYRSPAAERNRCDHRVTASRVGRVAGRRVAKSDRVSAIPVKRRLWASPVLSKRPISWTAVLVEPVVGTSSHQPGRSSRPS